MFWIVIHLNYNLPESILDQHTCLMLVTVSLIPAAAELHILAFFSWIILMFQNVSILCVHVTGIFKLHLF